MSEDAQVILALILIIGVPIAWLLHAVGARSAFKVMGLPLMTFGSACVTAAAQIGIGMLYAIVGYVVWSQILTSESPNADTFGVLLGLSAGVNGLISNAGVFMWRHTIGAGSAFGAAVIQFLVVFLLSLLIGFVMAIAGPWITV